MNEGENESIMPTEPAADIEVDSIRAENERLKEEIRSRGAAHEIESRLATAGARTPGLLAEKARDDFQFDEDGRLANPEALVEKLRRSYPEQFGRDIPAGSIDAGAGRNAAPPLTREALSRMTPDEIRRLDWDEVKSALSQM